MDLTTSTTPLGAPSTRNSVNVEQPVGTVQAIPGNSDLARFCFRASTAWTGGGASRSSIQDFYGAGVEDTSRAGPFLIEGDEPPVLLGSNRAPNAVELVLARRVLSGGRCRVQRRGPGDHHRRDRVRP
jgi:hypothetical protein